MCVRERERERERERIMRCMNVWKYVWTSIHSVCVCERERERERENYAMYECMEVCMDEYT